MRMALFFAKRSSRGFGTAPACLCSGEHRNVRLSLTTQVARAAAWLPLPVLVVVEGRPQLARVGQMANGERRRKVKRMVQVEAVHIEQGRSNVHFPTQFKRQIPCSFKVTSSCSHGAGNKIPSQAHGSFSPATTFLTFCWLEGYHVDGSVRRSQVIFPLSCVFEQYFHGSGLFHFLVVLNLREVINSLGISICAPSIYRSR